MLQNLLDKKIIVGITGGIAAYKAAELVRLLVAQKAKVQVIMTKSAQKFVCPLTFATLTNNSVHTEMFNQKLSSNIEHISLARWADAILIAPCSANTAAKLAHGLADDLLSTVCLATTSPICLAPAMNKEMWRNKITQQNFTSLVDRGVKIFGPAVGELACGEIGAGKMLEPAELVKYLANVFQKPLLKHKKIIVTAGPTIENIDPVRFISNYSSGKMGYAVAEAAANYGGDVVLISGPTNIQPPNNVKCIKVTSCYQMLDAVMANIKGCDIFIAAAAVADYRVSDVAPNKIKKKQLKMQLNLVKNPDILATVASQKNPPLTVGFAAETGDLTKNALLKLKCKKIDIIAANVVAENIGFNAETNALQILSKKLKPVELSKKNKSLLAQELIEFIADYAGKY